MTGLLLTLDRDSLSNIMMSSMPFPDAGVGMFSIIMDALQMHWPLPDPSKLTSSAASDEAIRRAFFDVMDTIERRTQTVLDIYQQCSDQKVFLERLSHHIASEVQE